MKTFDPTSNFLFLLEYLDPETTIVVVALYVTYIYLD